MAQEQNKPVVQHRLSQEAYDSLEKQAGLTIPQSNTTEVQAGFMLGIQHVLGLVRKGFTVGS